LKTEEKYWLFFFKGELHGNPKTGLPDSSVGHYHSHHHRTEAEQRRKLVTSR